MAYTKKKMKSNKKCDTNNESQNFQFYNPKFMGLVRLWQTNNYLRMPL